MLIRAGRRPEGLPDQPIGVAGDKGKLLNQGDAILRTSPTSLIRSLHCRPSRASTASSGTVKRPRSDLGQCQSGENCFLEPIARLLCSHFTLDAHVFQEVLCRYRISGEQTKDCLLSSSNYPRPLSGFSTLSLLRCRC